MSKLILSFLILCNLTFPANSFREASQSIFRMLEPLGQSSGGTGFQVSFQGKKFVITNAHVCAMNFHGYVLATQEEKDQIFYLKIIKEDEQKDLCMLQPAGDLPGLEIAPKPPEPQDAIYILGHPLLLSITLAQGYAGIREYTYFPSRKYKTEKECTQPNYSWEDTDFGSMCMVKVEGQTHSANSSPGNSGSPMLNASFQVVGVNFARYTGAMVGLFIPSDVLLKFITEK